MTATARTRPPTRTLGGALDPRARLGRLRATAAVGGLAVLLGGAVAVPRPAAAARTGGLTSATAHLGAVARTGGQP